VLVFREGLDYKWRSGSSTGSVDAFLTSRSSDFPIRSFELSPIAAPRSGQYRQKGSQSKLNDAWSDSQLFQGHGEG
jgi:hypothetical protein